MKAARGGRPHAGQARRIPATWGELTLTCVRPWTGPETSNPFKRGRPRVGSCWAELEPGHPEAVSL